MMELVAACITLLFPITAQRKTIPRVSYHNISQPLFHWNAPIFYGKNDLDVISGQSLGKNWRTYKIGRLWRNIAPIQNDMKSAASPTTILSQRGTKCPPNSTDTPAKARHSCIIPINPNIKRDKNKPMRSFFLSLKKLLNINVTSSESTIKASST